MIQYILFASMENIRGYSLMLGIAGIMTGIFLINAHKRSYLEAIRKSSDRRLEKFESRKFRRRATVAAMVASAGCLLAALFWVNEARIFAIFILLIMSLLIGILGIAVIDLLSVSLHKMTRTDDANQQKLVDEYLRQREQASKEMEEP